MTAKCVPGRNRPITRGPEVSEFTAVRLLKKRPKPSDRHVNVSRHQLLLDTEIGCRTGRFDATLYSLARWSQRRETAACEAHRVERRHRDLCPATDVTKRRPYRLCRSHRQRCRRARPCQTSPAPENHFSMRPQAVSIEGRYCQILPCRCLSFHYRFDPRRGKHHLIQ